MESHKDQFQDHFFILFINDLHKPVEVSSVHYFADDTNLILTDKSMKKINKHVNTDLKLVVQWSRTNKLSLNTSKTELVIFKPKYKIITKHLNFRISGQKTLEHAFDKTKKATKLQHWPVIKNSVLCTETSKNNISFNI